jgi:hypothetical protein
MSHYFFDTHDGDRFVPDQDGLDLDGIEQAKATAMGALPDLARDVLPDGDEREFAVIVRDEDGRRLLKVSLSLKVEPLT